MHGQRNIKIFSGITWMMDWTTMALLRTQESSEERKINV